MASLASQPAVSGGHPGQPRPVSQAQRSKEAEAAFLASLKSEGSKIDAELQRRAKDIQSNAQNLDRQDKKVQDATKQLSKESDALEKFLKKTEKQVPQSASFEDEIARLEAELDLIDETLDEVEQVEPAEEAEEAEEAEHTAAKDLPSASHKDSHTESTSQLTKKQV